MLKIVIPLGGSSELFSIAGFPYPKPLIEVLGKPMVQWVIESTNSFKLGYQRVFLIKEDDANSFHLDNTLKLLDPDCEIIKIKNNTKGGLCSVLISIDVINDCDDILILNGDQFIDFKFADVYLNWENSESDVGLVTFKSVHPRWSFALIENGNVIQTAEKNPISNNAIAGYYYFKKAKTFFDCAFQTIKDDVQKEGLFYISSVINEYILRNMKVHHFEIEKVIFHSFYTPKLIAEFESIYNEYRKI